MLQIANLKQLLGLQKQKMAMCIITSKSNSSFGTIAKATGVKMTAKAVGENSATTNTVCLLSLFPSFKCFLECYLATTELPRKELEGRH